MNFKLVTLIALVAMSAPAFADVDITPEAAQAANQPKLDPAQEAGAAFLAANRSKPGVIAMPDGLQYKVLKAGTGPKPADTDVVTVQYEGRLINGTVFDSSASHGGTIDFPVGQVIAGWVEALKMMPMGSTWELYIPSDLAYGAAGAPPSIGPNETLIFKVTLVKITKA